MKSTFLMRNVLTLARYDQPTQLLSTDCERLIVEKIDVEGLHFLTITEAGKCDANEVDVPDELIPGTTMVGTLIRAEPGSARRLYILNRTLPSELDGHLPGWFFPSDGFAEYSEQATRPTLKVSSRHAHDADITPPDHLPDPVNPDRGLTWLFDAHTVPWAGASIDANFSFDGGLLNDWNYLSAS